MKIEKTVFEGMCLTISTLKKELKAKDKLMKEVRRSNLILINERERGKGTVDQYQQETEKLRAEVQMLKQEIEQHKEYSDAMRPCIEELQDRVKTQNLEIAELRRFQ